MITRILVTSALLLAAGAAARSQDAPDPSTLQFFAYPISAEVAIVDVDAAALAQAGTGAAGGASAADQRSEFSDELFERLRGQLEAIERQLAAGGPRSDALADELVRLALLFGQAGEHLSAISVLDQALSIVRRNSGLYSSAQVGVIGHLIDNWLALGQRAQVAELERQLFEIVTRNQQEAGVASVLKAIADRHMESFELLLEAEMLPFARHSALAALRRARFHYSQAQLAAIREGSHTPLELFELEERIIQTYYIEVAEPELRGQRRQPSGPLAPVFGPGEVALQAHVANSAAFRLSPGAVSRALVRLGDWRLLFSQNSRAIDTYRQAHELLIAADADAETVDELFAPSVPVVIPAHSVAQSAATPPYHGYIDVSFVIGKYGTPRNVRILDASDATDREATRRLRRELYGSRFRPPLVDGEIGQATSVSARYYYKYRTPT